MANNSIIWFPFYLGDYLKDTQHLNVIEHGIYLKLMIYYYSTGKPIENSRRYAVTDAMALPADMLGQSSGCQMVDNVLNDFFIKKGNFWHHNRIDAEIKKRAEYHEKQRERAKKRWEGSKKTTSKQAMPRHSQRICHGNAISQSHCDIYKNKKKYIKKNKGELEKNDFDLFWKLYPKKVAKKDAAKKFEKALQKTNLENILNGLKNYIAEINLLQREKQFIQNPATWLNQERWEDEYQTQGVLKNDYRKKQTIADAGNEIINAITNGEL